MRASAPVGSIGTLFNLVVHLLSSSPAVTIFFFYRENISKNREGAVQLGTRDTVYIIPSTGDRDAVRNNTKRERQNGF